MTCAVAWKFDKRLCLLLCCTAAFAADCIDVIYSKRHYTEKYQFLVVSVKKTLLHYLFNILHKNSFI